MKRIETALPGVVLIEPDVFADARGFFFESYHQAKFAELGITDCFVQDNHSRSVRGTLRGLHYQLHHPQAKLCRVIQGAVLDVAVDIRRGSATFGRWVGAELSAENRRQIYVPIGFAHGFVVLSETAEFLYKCSDLYRPEDEHGIQWNDPALKIDWRVTGPILSAKDRAFLPLAQTATELLPIDKSSKSAPVRRVLSLGKHPPVLNTRNQLLKAAGYEVVPALSVNEAMKKMSGGRLDLIIIGYTFSKAEKRQLSREADRLGLKVLLLYLKPADRAIPAAMHLNAMHGERQLLEALTTLLPIGARP